MKIKLLLLFLIVISSRSFSQINELDTFRQQLTDFIKYDTGYSATDAEKFKLTLDKSFRKFVLLKDFSMDMNTSYFENLKKRANNNTKGYLYSFFELRRDYNNNTTKNNVNYYIGFFGLHDYKSPNIITIYIQPCSSGNENYMIYYYSMNNKGTYFIKNVLNNEIVFESTALTANAPILKFTKIDNNHFLTVEDMGDNGQRALVIQIENNKWQSINAFKGKSFNTAALDYSLKKETAIRKYLWIASNRKITAHMRERPFELSWIFLNESNKELSYKRYNKIWKESQIINAKWTKLTFTIDDYYIGEDYK